MRTGLCHDHGHLRLGCIFGSRSTSGVVDVIHVEADITNFVIRIMRDGEKGVYEGWLQPPWI